jgi:RNA polymerase sigma factor (sigma-70 family)
LTPRPLTLSGRRRQRAAGERIGKLFEEHGRMVYGVCRLIVRDPTEAEDAAQQTFLSAYRALLNGQEPRDPSAWLGTIARNECSGRLRSRKAEPLTLVTAATVDETQREAARHEEIEALTAALAQLPQQQRDAIVLREFYGLSYAEVGAALGISGAAVESLLFRSRRRLQEHLRPLRAALGALVLPPSLSESLAQSLPGFGGGGAGAGAVVMAKVGGAPLAAKLAALTLTVGAVGTAAGLETGARHRSPQRSHESARPAAARTHASTSPRLAAVPVAETVERSHVSHQRGEHERAGREHETGDDNGGSNRGKAAPATETRESEPGHETTTETDDAHGGGTTETETSDDGGGGDHHGSGGGGGEDHHDDEGSGGGS